MIRFKKEAPATAEPPEKGNGIDQEWIFPEIEEEVHGEEGGSPELMQEPGGEIARRLGFEDLEPWPDPVQGDELLFGLRSILRKHLILPKPAEIAIPLWVAHAYLYEEGWVSPILAILSPEYQCGKSTLLNLLEALVNRPFLASNITPAALFRTVEAVRPTLLIDEVDTQISRKLRNVLNSGHLRNGAVIRVDGKNREPVRFNTFCPKALAKIGSLPDTLRDRSVVVTINRRSPGDREVEPVPIGVINNQLKPLRRKILRWAEDNREAVREADPDFPEGLSARAQDNWRPLLAVADLCGSAWAKGSRDAATFLTKVQEENATGTLLLKDIRDIIRTQTPDVKAMPSEYLAKALAKLQDRPWFDWPGPKGFTPHKLAELLRPYGIRPKVLWQGACGDGWAARGYEFSAFEDAFDRYREPLPAMRPGLQEHPSKAAAREAGEVWRKGRKSR